MKKISTCFLGNAAPSPNSGKVSIFVTGRASRGSNVLTCSRGSRNVAGRAQTQNKTIMHALPMSSWYGAGGVNGRKNRQNPSPTQGTNSAKF